MWDSDSSGSFGGWESDDLPLGLPVPRSVHASDVSSASPVSTPPTSEDEYTSDDDDEDLDRWRDTLTDVRPPAFTRPSGPTVNLPGTATELDFFRAFFPVGLLTLLVAETNRFARVAADPKWTDTTEAELSAWLGIAVVMSVIPVPEYSLLWTTRKFWSLASVAEIMTRDR